MSGRYDPYDLLLIRPLQLLCITSLTLGLCHGQGLVTWPLLRFPFSFVGKLTWPFYLLHFPIIGLLSNHWALDPADTEAPGLAYFAIALFASLSAAWLAQEYLQTRVFVWLAGLRLC